MVKHGRNKKRRAGRIGRTQLKNRSYTTWNPKPKITDDTVKKLWDVKRTPAQNLAAMGLALTPNPETDPQLKMSSSTNNNNHHNTTASPNTAIALFDVPESDDLTNQTKKKKRPLSADDQACMVACLAKHGTNYTAMFRDTKVNQWQHTETKLRQLATRFLLLEPEQVAVEHIPDSVQKLMMVMGDTNNDAATNE